MSLTLTPHDERAHGESEMRKLARRLGRSYAACRNRYQVLKRKAGHVAGPWTNEGLWRDEEDRLIRTTTAGFSDCVPGEVWSMLAEALGRTPGAVRLRHYNLTR